MPLAPAARPAASPSPLLDQAGNVIERVLDADGRETARKETTLDGDFGSAVRRIESAYDALQGRLRSWIQTARREHTPEQAGDS